MLNDELQVGITLGSAATRRRNKDIFNKFHLSCLKWIIDSLQRERMANSAVCRF